MIDVPDILELARKLQMPIKGVSFHCGSGGVEVEP